MLRFICPYGIVLDLCQYTAVVVVKLLNHIRHVFVNILLYECLPFAYQW